MTVVMAGNHDFPSASVDQTVLRASDLHTVCPHPQPSAGVANIAGYVAFRRGVRVEA